MLVTSVNALKNDPGLLAALHQLAGQLRQSNDAAVLNVLHTCAAQVGAMDVGFR